MANEELDKVREPDAAPESEGESAPITAKARTKWAKHRVRIGETASASVTNALTASGYAIPITTEWSQPTWNQAIQLGGTGWEQTADYSHINSRIFIGAGTEILEAREHQKTRELISEKLSDLALKQDLIEAKEGIITALKSRIDDLEASLREVTSELVKAKELEACSNRLCEQVSLQGQKSREHMTKELDDLRRYLGKFAPHKRFFKVTFGFLCFFLLATFANSVLGVRIIEPFWNVIGIVLTTAMLIVIYFGMKDVQARPVTPDKH